MRAVVQRVLNASVEIEGKVYSSIDKGLLVLLGVSGGDTQQDVDYIVKKIAGLRIFEDTQGKQNLSVKDISGEIMVVSQFTLLGDVRKGNRPSYSDAMEPQMAERIYRQVVEGLCEDFTVATGSFGSMMHVGLVNDGPVTILLDSRRMF